MQGQNFTPRTLKLQKQTVKFATHSELYLNMSQLFLITPER